MGEPHVFYFSKNQSVGDGIIIKLIVGAKRLLAIS